MTHRPAPHPSRTPLRRGATRNAQEILAALPTAAVTTSMSTAVLQRRDTGVLLLLDGTESSWIDLVDPAHLDFEYQQQMNAMLEALLPEPAVVHAVHLGGAGCALARAWEARRPGSRQTAVEIDAILAHKVRQWFDLPRAPRLRIRVGDAAEVVTSLRQNEWDVVVRDVFASGVVPDRCRTQGFMQACAHALAPGGLYLANMSSTPRLQAGAELAAARSVFPGLLVVADPAVARGKRRGNLVLLGRASPFEPHEREAMERAARRLPLPVRTWQVTDPALPRP